MIRHLTNVSQSNRMSNFAKWRPMFTFCIATWPFALTFMKWRIVATLDGDPSWCRNIAYRTYEVEEPHCWYCGSMNLVLKKPPPPPGIPAPLRGYTGRQSLRCRRYVATNRHQFCLLRIITDPAKTEYQDSHRLAALLAGKPFLDPENCKLKFLAPFLV